MILTKVMISTNVVILTMSGEEYHGESPPVCAQKRGQEVGGVRPLRLLCRDHGHPRWMGSSGFIFDHSSLDQHDQLCLLKVLLAHCVYLINVVGQMFFTDAFLGYEFSK